ncbi:MAG: hypothetical protein R3F43_07155 [bacterium]
MRRTPAGQVTTELKSRHPADDVFARANPALLRGESCAVPSSAATAAAKSSPSASTACRAS